MKCNPWPAMARLGALGWICWALAGCGSTPKPVVAKLPLQPLNPSCAWVPGPGGESQLACQLANDVPDTQWDAKHPGSVACSADSFSVFRQALSTPLRLSFSPKDEDRLSQVRIGGTMGPGTLTGKVGKSAGNDCDATLGPVATVSTRYSGSYTALVDKSQVPACVRQSRLVLSTFEQTLPAFLPAGMAQVAREITTDALQKQLDLEVATRLHQSWRPTAPALPQAVVDRSGRCPDGFQSYSGR